MPEWVSPEWCPRNCCCVPGIAVSQATWKGVQGDPAATLTPSAGEIFYLWGNSTDPTYAQTNTVLATYRLQLLNRSLSSFGPPPYANCP